MENESRARRIEEFLLDPEKVLFESIQEFKEATDIILPFLQQIDPENLETIVGEDGYTPQRGVDYMTDADLDLFEEFILSITPVAGVSFPTIEQTQEYIAERVSLIPRVKGRDGKSFTYSDLTDEQRAELKGRDGSADSGAEILGKLRGLGKNQGLKMKDIRGLEGKVRFLNDVSEEVTSLREDISKIRIAYPVNTDSDTPVSSVAWGAITGTLADQTDLQDALDLKYNANNPNGFTSNVGTVTSVSGGTGLTGAVTSAGSISLNAGTIASLGLADTALQNITGLVSEGTNVTITGTGTNANPYVINAGGGGAVSWGDIVGTLADQTDLDTALGLKYNANNPDGFTTNVGTVTSVSGGTGLSGTVTSAGSISLSAGTIASLGLADTAIQNLAGLGITATAGELNILDGVTATTAELNYLDGVTSDIQAQLDTKSTPAGAETLTNKRPQPRTSSSTTNATLTPNLSSANVYYRTTQAVALTINAPIGTPVIGETIFIYVDSVAVQTLTVNVAFVVFGAAFPAEIPAGKTLMISAQFNGTDWKTLWAIAI